MSNDTASYAVFLQDVRHGYDQKTVLDNVDLAVRPGEFVTLVGPSGCGKSTLLRLLLGAEIPRGGRVEISGVRKAKPDKDCGIVYQKYSVFPHLTVLENVVLGPMLDRTGMITRTLRLPPHGRLRKQTLEEAHEFLRIIGLEDAAQKYPYQLSGGMQQRVAIAQALIMHPKVLLLDEPFSALDPWTREQLQLYLLELWSEKRMTIFFVTHDIEEAIFLGTRIVVLSQRYRTGLGEARGARITVDLPIPGAHPRPLSFKTSKELNDMLALVRSIAFDRKNGDELTHVGDFVLTHPDSFHTTSQEEMKR